MSHFTRTQTDGTWTTGNYVTLVSDWQSLSDKIFKSVNGDLGGCWAPSSPIAIDTAGLLVTAPSSVAYGGSLKTLAGARFVLGAGATDWPKLAKGHAGNKRSIRQELLARQSSPRLHWCAATNYIGSIQSIACTVQGPSFLEQPTCSIPLRVHDGSRLTGATLTFRIPTTRTKAPLQMPKVRMLRTDKDGNTVSMTSAAAGADAQGFVSMPKVLSGPAWYAGGVAQTFEIPCDQNNAIDTSQYLYWATLVEEAGTLTIVPVASCDGVLVRERKPAVKYAYTDGTLPPFTGTAGLLGGLVAGDTTLVIDPGMPRYTGIWVVGGSPWVRRSDMSAATDFTPGVLIVDETTWNVWEVTSPTSNQKIALADFTVTPLGTDIFIQRRLPRGNIYHALTTHFDDITDMRPQ